MHSPWGVLYQLVKETGWSWNQLLWETSYANLMLMMADRPNFKPAEEMAIPETGKELAARFSAKKSK